MNSCAHPPAAIFCPSSMCSNKTSPYSFVLPRELCRWAASDTALPIALRLLTGCVVCMPRCLARFFATTQHAKTAHARTTTAAAAIGP